MYSYDASEHIQNENLLPSQFFDTRRSAEKDPYHRLWFAVIEDTVRRWQDVWSPHSRMKEGKRLAFRIEITEWISSAYMGIGSFTFVCETCGVEPTQMREALERMKTAAWQFIPRRTPNRSRAGLEARGHRRKRFINGQA